MPEQDFTLTSPAFENGGGIPITFTCDGDDVSPGLEWANVPEGTKSFALIVEDPDAPDGTFTQWILYDVPAGLTSLPESATDVGKSGRNDFEETGYGGPCPPTESGDHRYFFHLHALDVESLGLPETPTRKQFDEAVAGHVLGTAELMGVFQRE